MLYIPSLPFEHFSSMCSYRPACYYLDTPQARSGSLSTACIGHSTSSNHSTMNPSLPLMVTPSGDRNYTFGPWILSLTHSLVVIQVEYSCFSLFVVVMFYRVACDTEWVMLNHWTEKKYRIKFMVIFALITCTTNSIHNVIVWFYANFHVKAPI